MRTSQELPSKHSQRFWSLVDKNGPLQKNMQTHCKNGHELKEENLVKYELQKLGWRSCKIYAYTRKANRRLAAK